MLVTMKEILDAAKKGNYCVPAPNYGDEIDLAACIAAAEEAESPLILDIGHSGDLDGFIRLAKASRDAAEKTWVPCCINLDHGGSFDHIVQAIHYGCTSVMIDRSSLDFADNVAQTKEIVKIAHAVGVSVESELGHVGQNAPIDPTPTENKEGHGEDKEVVRNSVTSDEEKRKFYTNPEEAVKFVEETGVDCLAVAVGTVHGLYPEGFKPSIDFDLLKELSEKVSVPLVIHGGSGTGEELLNKASQLGANKLNVGSDLFKAKALGLIEAVKKGEKNPIAYASNCYKEELKAYMGYCNSKGKAKR